MRHTKIIATLGPASADESVIEQLIEAGVDIFRMNFSHGSHESHAELFGRVRRASERVGRVVATMQDLSGPKIRTGRIEGGRPLTLARGGELRIVTGDSVGVPGRVSTMYAELARSVRPGDRLLLDDGRIELRVEETSGTEIVTRVVDGGQLGEHKGINAPGVALPVSAMTVKDADDVRFGIELGVDMVAVSFVQTAADIERAHELIAVAGRPVPVIAKIERPMAVDNIESILDRCEGVMVARGDLGLEMPLERVPRVQKEITRRARARGIPVIVATQVLESMRTEPRPTRAEVSDAANAVDDAVDAIMLAGETAVGAFPVRAVQTLDVVIRDAEALLPAYRAQSADGAQAEHGRALCEAAVTLASSGQADAIVAVTRGGKTARILSSLRPRASIYATTDTPVTARGLCLLWGVTPLMADIGQDVGASSTVEEQLVTRGVLGAGSVVVSVSVNEDLSRADANFLKLRRVAG